MHLPLWRCLVATTAVVVCAGCQTGRGSFQMDSDSRVPYFNFNLLSIANEAPGRTSDDERPSTPSRERPDLSPRSFLPAWIKGQDSETVVPLTSAADEYDGPSLSGPAETFR